jgi:hypothetical protein
MVDHRDAVVAGDPRRCSHGRFTAATLTRASAVFGLVTGDDTHKDVS